MGYSLHPVLLQAALETHIVENLLIMFSLLLSGRLGDMIAPRLEFDEELTSLLKVAVAE